MLRLWIRRAAPGVACAVTAAAVLTLAGCGGSGGADNKAVVVITDPSKLGTGGASASPTAETSGSPEAGTPSPGAESTAATAAPATAEGWGTLRGRVVFEGEIPTLAPVVAQGANVPNAEICAKEPIPSEKLVVDPASRGVRWAIVYIPRPTAVNPEAESEAKAKPIEFDQKGCRFLPHALAAMKGATVHIKSSDQAGHNVHSRLRGTSFNQTISPGGTLDVQVKTPDGRPAQVVCDIHPWMSAWWLTLNNPYFAVTNEKGEFEIKNVPAGEQKVTVWAEAVNPGFLTSSASGDPVTIKADDTTTVEYTLKAAQVK
jgi:plastocyanin